MELNFFYAKHKHRMWKMKLKAFLLGLDELDENKIVSSDSCILGQWINNYGWEAYKEYPEMKKFVDLHEKIHQIVRDIPGLKKKNKLEEARNKFKELDKESDKLIELLDILQQKEKQKEEQKEKTEEKQEEQVVN
ncbi:MAG: CZB domain-containing protein [Bacteroidales bacterium]|nr:CZB domain-containing protein [Bacteroidales bacterium]